MENIYTDEIIKDAWKDYTTKKVLKMLIKGEWVIKPLDEHKGPVAATKAEVVVISKTMGFPKFLRKYYG